MSETKEYGPEMQAWLDATAEEDIAALQHDKFVRVRRNSQAKLAKQGCGMDIVAEIMPGNPNYPTVKVRADGGAVRLAKARILFLRDYLNELMPPEPPKPIDFEAMIKEAEGTLVGSIDMFNKTPDGTYASATSKGQSSGVKWLASVLQELLAAAQKPESEKHSGDIARCKVCAEPLPMEDFRVTSDICSKCESEASDE